MAVTIAQIRKHGIGHLHFPGPSREGQEDAPVQTSEERYWEEFGDFVEQNPISRPGVRARAAAGDE